MSARHVYVHVPFCRRRCTYCDFSIAVRRTVPVARFVAAVAAELRLAFGAAPTTAAPLSTLYLGGGTPSLLGGEGVAALACALRAGPGLEEFTLEANPDDVTPEVAAAWVRAGVNRLSLGAQSFDEGVLRWMHRSHDASAIGAAVVAARRAGVASISLDLIFALPEALGRDLAADLDRALALQPDHVSLYGLTVEDGTPLGRRVATGRESPATEARYEDEYLAVVRRLTAHGFRFYEVSNAAHPGSEAVHNQAYWRLAPYVGLGPSAHSFDGATRWWNEAAYSRWLARVEAGESPVAGREILRPEQQRLEMLYLGLRTADGIAMPEPPGGTMAATVAGWVGAGWADVADGRLRLTPRGWLRLDELAASL